MSKFFLVCFAGIVLFLAGCSVVDDGTVDNPVPHKQVDVTKLGDVTSPSLGTWTVVRGPEETEFGCTVELVSFESDDGAFYSRLYLPEEGEKPYPVVIGIHGGMSNSLKKAQATPKTTDAVGLAWGGHLCPLGIAVLTPDYMWSPFGLGEMKSIALAYDFLKSRDEIDEDKIVISGESHGGYMTMRMITFDPSDENYRKFAAAINFYGFVNISLLAEGELNNPQAKITEETLGEPKDNLAAYKEISPIYHKENVNVPLLIVVGTEDQYIDSIRGFAGDLKKQGKDLEYHEIEGAPHGIAATKEQDEVVYREQLWDYAVEFLKEQVL